MKINDPKLAGLTSSQVGGAQAPESPAERQKKTEKSGEIPRDRVSLSELSSKVRALDSESPERAARLERLSAEVAAGRYHVDAVEVARKMVSDAQDDRE